MNGKSIHHYVFSFHNLYNVKNGAPEILNLYNVKNGAPLGESEEISCL